MWCPRRRLAAAPGRLARPAPPGNDDPCEEKRTIPEGMPRLPREAFERGFRRAVPNPPKPLAKGDGQRRARARARNPTWSAERRASRRWERKTPHAGRACPVCANREASARRSKARSRASCVSVYDAPRRVPRMHPSAIGAPPPLKGGELKRSEWRIGEKRIGRSEW